MSMNSGTPRQPVLLNVIVSSVDSSSIGASDGVVGRDACLFKACERIETLEQLIQEVKALEQYVFGRSFPANSATADTSHDRTGEQHRVYHLVRAILFLAALFRYVIPERVEQAWCATASPNTETTECCMKWLRERGSMDVLPKELHTLLTKRKFAEAIRALRSADVTQCGECSTTLDALSRSIYSVAYTSALACAYHERAFQMLAKLVRSSVRALPANNWLFNTHRAEETPLRVHPDLFEGVLEESTPVRMDFTHSGWSDIFFLAMDFPSGARVVNASIDICVRSDGSNALPTPPIATRVRVIDMPLIRLVSVDLDTVVELTRISQVFDFGRDYLGLLKAAVVASGVIPPGLDPADRDIPLSDVDDEDEMIALLRTVLGVDGKGLEIISEVRGIPKGSRLAVSTNLLASLIALLMRATKQTKALCGELSEDERGVIVGRAILGEWLGGSGGGWQDSGGLWPGVKVLKGVVAQPGDLEYGSSIGRLLPACHVLREDVIPRSTLRKIADSLVLVHGGMAQNVGPILEMVTERYMLRCSEEWRARQHAIGLFDDVLSALKCGDVKRLASLTHRNFEEVLQNIMPWCGNAYANALIAAAREEFGDEFWGFWMLGGMAGGGMGFWFDPAVLECAKLRLKALMKSVQQSFERSLPFAIEPVVYDFNFNQHGSTAELLRPGSESCNSALSLSSSSVDGAPCPTPPRGEELRRRLAELGFDDVTHERMRERMKRGDIGLAQNRLDESCTVEDVHSDDVEDFRDLYSGSERLARFRAIGEKCIGNGEIAIVTLAGGVGSRWTDGANVVKALNPFAGIGSDFRTFLEVHLRKTRKVASMYDTAVPHVITTSYMTHGPIEKDLLRKGNYGYEAAPLYLSQGKMVGVRMIPCERDLEFWWAHSGEVELEAQAQKVRESGRAGIRDWARGEGEARDYFDGRNPDSCLHPVGHFYEVSNLIANGTIARLLRDHPSVKYLLLHNIDTLGADVDPVLLGYHVCESKHVTMEMVMRRISDAGGGLARVNGRVQLVEGLALASPEQELSLRYYNSSTSWITIQSLLDFFGLSKEDLLADGAYENPITAEGSTCSSQLKCCCNSPGRRIAEAVRETSEKMPMYVTIKQVKKRWGNGQEDVLPVTQWERLWGDVTAFQDTIPCSYVCVPLKRGQQIKSKDQLDGWLRDGSAAHIATLGDFQ